MVKRKTGKLYQTRGVKSSKKKADKEMGEVVKSKSGLGIRCKRQQENEEEEEEEEEGESQDPLVQEDFLAQFFSSSAPLMFGSSQVD